MANCTYILTKGAKNFHFDSYEDLVRYLQDSYNFDEIADVLYSSDENLQTSVVDHLKELQQQNKGATYDYTSFNPKTGDFDDNINRSDNTQGGVMSVNAYLDSNNLPQQFVNQNLYIPFNADEYLERQKMTLKRQGLESSEIDTKINEIKDKWEFNKKISKEFNSLRLTQQDQRATKAKETLFENHVNLVDRASGIIWARAIDNTENKQACISNIRITTRTKDNRFTLMSHMDFCRVDEKGDLHIYLVKTTLIPMREWDQARWDMYKMQAAFLKQMLAANGFKVDKIHIDIIPVQFIIDNEDVKDIIVQNCSSLTHTNNYNNALVRQDLAVKEVLEDKIQPVQPFESTIISSANEDLKRIFPDNSVNAEGIRATAKEWLNTNWSTLNPKTISENGKIVGWRVIIPTSEGQKSIEVHDKRIGGENQALVKILEEDIKNFGDPVYGINGRSDLVNAIQRVLNQSESNPDVSLYFPNKNVSRTFNKLLHEYINDRDYELKTNYDEEGNPIQEKETIDMHWEILDFPSLQSTNMVILHNKKTRQIDVIALTQCNLDEKHIVNGRRKILNNHITDSNPNYHFDMDATYANIESIKVMCIINSLVETGNLYDVELGKLKIINANYSTGRVAHVVDFATLTKQFSNIYTVLNKLEVNKEENNELVNYIQKYSGAIGCMDPIDVMAQEINTIQNSFIDNSNLSLTFSILHDIVDGEVNYDDKISFAKLKMATTTEDQIMVCNEILYSLASHLKSDIGKFSKLSADDISQIINDQASSDELKIYARMYASVSNFLCTLTGIKPNIANPITQIEALALKPSSSPCEPLRIIARLINQAIDRIRYKTWDYYGENCLATIDEVYNSCGIKNPLVGTYARVWKNFFVYDANGHNTFIFKDPYDPRSDLKPYERKALKEILFMFYIVKCNNQDVDPMFSGPNDPDLENIDKRPASYLLCPLQKVSSSTKRAMYFKNLKNSIHLMKKNASDPRTTSEIFFDELIKQTNEDIKNTSDRDYSGFMNVINPYTSTEGDAVSDNISTTLDRRQHMINEFGEEYFEINLENILLDYIFYNIQVREFNDLLLKTQAVEIAIKLRSIDEGNEDQVNKVIELMDKYITVNVFNKSIMDTAGKMLNKFLFPIRRLVTIFYVAGNLRGATRDFLMGFQNNFLSALNKFKTDVTGADIAYAYGIVGKESLIHPGMMSLLNQFNIKYSLSSFDPAQVNKKMRRDSHDFLNGLFWTMRAPDYTNRQVLLIAKMHHDGTFQAYSLENGRVKYDWRKDKRFSLLSDLKADRSSDAYLKQVALYESLIRKFNKEKATGEKLLQYTDDLPDAYTMEDIKKIKELGENLYGNYDRSSKPFYESYLIGRQWLVFSTFLNGIVDSYWRRQQIVESNTGVIQETDYVTGAPLFFENDISGTLTTRDTGLPVYKDIPIPVQGILNTVFELYRECVNSRSLRKAWSDVTENSVNRANLRKMISDFALWTILGVMFKHIITPKYKEHKKNLDPKKVIGNILIELLYNGAYDSKGVLTGPLEILNYLGNQTTLKVYALPVRFFGQLRQLLCRNIGFDFFVLEQTATMRSIQESFKAWRKSYYGEAKGPIIIPSKDD